MLLRQFGLGREALRRPDVCEKFQQTLLDWIRGSSIDRAVLLAMDGVYDGEGRLQAKKTSWITDNDFVADLADAEDSVLFVASIHPYRHDALDQFERLARRGACLVKWIPSAQRIRLDDPRCFAFYEGLAEYGIPLLVHTGNEHIAAWGRNAWNHPDLLRDALVRGVTVIAAHCGARLFLHERCYFRAFCRMALQHERLFGDISAFGLPTRIPMLRKLQSDDRLLSKVLYGSDFPVTTMPRWFLLSIGLSGVRQVVDVKNPLERSYRLMREMGLPDAVFTRAGRLLRLCKPVGVES